MILRPFVAIAALFAAPLARADMPPPMPAPTPSHHPRVPGEKPRAGEPIDDEALEAYLLEKGTKLVQTGQTLGDWSKALGPRRAAASVAKPASPTLTLAEAVRKVEASTVVLGIFFEEKGSPELRMETASGFIASADGAIVTARHVLDFTEPDRANDKPRGVLAMTRTGRLLSIGSVLACDPANDIVVLKTEAQGLAALPLTRISPPGTAVGVLAHSDCRFYSLTTGIVSRHWKARDDEGAVTAYVAITADFSGGASGGPVFDLSGAVVGVVNSTESIYFDDDGTKQTDLQMVVKNATPAAAVLDLLAAPTPDTAERR